MERERTNEEIQSLVRVIQSEGLCAVRVATRPGGYRISPEKSALLDAAFLAGKSQREAARLAGVAKATASRLIMMRGGLKAYRERGAQFKQNRWR